MICWRCKKEMPDGLKYCGNCGVHMNRTIHTLQWLFSKKGLPVTLTVLAAIVGAVITLFLLTRIPPIDIHMGTYTPKEINIVYHDDSKSYGYVNNMILVFFTKDATDKEITKIVESVDGEIVGVLPGVRQYQVQVTTSSSEELENLRKKLMEYDQVKNAVIDTVGTFSSSAHVPNDPWNDPSGQNDQVYWNEDSPSGANWWVEAAHIQSAWKYLDQLAPINVGIVDSGFDLSHEDLKITVLNEEVNNYDDHGTHVAGIIGATHDNGVGITGVLRDVNMYGVDWQATAEQKAQNIPISSILAGIDTCIYNGCKVVNLSAGLVYQNPSSTAIAAQRNARDTATYLIMMLDMYEDDFFITKSAGNSSVDSFTYAGYFSSIDEALVQDVLEDMKADGVKLEKDITVQDVMDCFIVVGAVDLSRKDESYQLSTFSNFGSSVGICAPGVAVLSCVPTGNAYEYFNGTSMAAPIAAGVAGMVWSANPELTAGEVKQILISTATEPVLPRTEGDTGTYYMINAEAAVEAALGMVSDDPTNPSEEPTEPPTDGTLELPSLEAFLGKNNYTVVQVNYKITEKGNKDATGYECILAVDKDEAGLLDSYITLLESYGFQLVSQENDVFLLRYTAANAPTPFSQSTENSYHVSLILTDEGDTVHVIYKKHRDFITVNIPFSEAN